MNYETDTKDKIFPLKYLIFIKKIIDLSQLTVAFTLE